jgi:hypothetical protein
MSILGVIYAEFPNKVHYAECHLKLNTQKKNKYILTPKVNFRASLKIFSHLEYFI